MVQAPAKPDTSRPAELVEFAGKAIPAFAVVERRYSRNPQGVSSGPEGQRSDQRGYVTAKIADFSGGLFKRRGDWRRDLNRQEYNEGLQTHVPGECALPYVLTTQSSLISVDASGYAAANLRVHGWQFNGGQSALRFGVGIDKYILAATSDSNPALRDVTPGGAALTNSITAVRPIRLNSADYLAFATNGQTNDIFGVTDITANPLTKTELVTYGDSNDLIWGMEYLNTAGLDHVPFWGRYGDVTSIFYAKSTDSIPITTLKRVVLAETKDIDNTSNSTENTGAKSPGGASAGAFLDAVQLGTVWTNPTNALTSNDSRATVTVGTNTSALLAVHTFGFNVPSSAKILGVLVEIEKSEAAATDNMADEAVVLINGIDTIYDSTSSLYVTSTTAISDNKADTSTEWPITGSEAYTSYGGSADLWGATLTPAIVNSSGFGAAIAADGDNAGAIAQVDHIRMTVYYRLPGTPVTITEGGFMVGKLPGALTTVAAVRPVTDDASARNVPRFLEFDTFSYDSEGDRPVVSSTYPNTGLVTVTFAVPFAGGVAVCGDTSNNLAKKVLHVDAAGTVRDLGFLKHDGYASAVGVVNMFAAGSVLICEVANEDGTNAQWWYWVNGTWHASTPLQSKSAAIATVPLPWAEAAIDTHQQYRYRLYPVSTTGLSVARMFQPRNIFESALVNTTILKQNGPLFLRMQRLDFGPEENNKAFYSIRYLSREISATGGSYGTCQMEMDTGGDTAFSSAEINTGALDEAFEEYLVPSSGVPYRDAIPRITLNNAASSAKTPLGGPWLITMVQKFVIEREWDVYVDYEGVKSRYSHWTNLTSTLEDKVTTDAEANAQVIRRFKWGVVDVPATWENQIAHIRPPPLGSPITELSQVPMLTFREVKGKVTA